MPENKEISNDNRKKKWHKVLYVLCLLSFIPYFLTALAGMFGIEFGFFGNSEMYYGFEAVALIVAIFTTIIPVYPVLLVLQIIYCLWYWKSLLKKQKKLLIGILISIAVMAVVPGAFHYVRQEISISLAYNKSIDVIEDYLIERFGEEHAAKMQVRRPNEDSLWYYVNTPLMSNDISLLMNETLTEVQSDDFCSKFMESHDFQNKFDMHLTKEWKLPINTYVNSLVTNIDIRNYREGDAIETLFDDCTYRITSITIYHLSYDKNEIMEWIREIYINNAEALKDCCDDNSINVYVKVNDQYYASILIGRPSTDMNRLKLWFSGYSDGNGKTIEYSEEEINLLQSYN